MFDMHTHILHGVDDGCQTIEESLKMIRKAIEVGVTDLMVTPHYAPLRGYKVSYEEKCKKFKALQKAVNDANLSINLYAGREIDAIEKMDIQLEAKHLHTISDTEFVLVDYGMEKMNIDEHIYHLVIAGYKPIVAHPERYNLIHDCKLYERWKKTGALLQVNASNVTKPKSALMKKRIKYLIKNKLIDLVSTDAHCNPNVYDELEKAIKYVESKQKQPLFNLLEHIQSS